MTLDELNILIQRYRIPSITLDFFNSSYNTILSKQLDNCRYILCTTTENGVPRKVNENEVPRIRLQKPDQTYVYNDCETIEDGRVLVHLTEQMLAANGKAIADLQLTSKDGNIYSTKNFVINIDRTPYPPEAVESSNEFDALNNMIKREEERVQIVLALEQTVTENEKIRNDNEETRKLNEETRANNETARVNAENIRISNENTRQNNETVRQNQESNRQTNTATAISNAETATKKANDAADDLQAKLDAHHFVLTEDKDIAGGVPSLDSNGKVPSSELPVAGSVLGGIKSGTDITVDTAGNVSVNDNSHKHTLSNISDVTATATELNYTDGVTSNIQTQLNAKAPLASPALTGTPTAPTASAGTNTKQIATTAFVQTAISNGIAASDAMIIKGTIGTSGTVTALPTTYKTGWTYRVVTAGTYAGQVCEIGDLVIALADRSGSGNLDTDWCVAQTNINGAITGVKSQDAYISVSQSGSIVTITHADVARSDTTSSATPSHGGTFNAVKSVASDSKGHVTSVDTETVTMPDAYTHPSYTARSSGLYKVTVDGTGHVSAATTVTKADITALGIPGSNTDTHYTSKNVVGLSTATADTTSALSNGNVYLNSVENGTVTSSHKISGSGATTVTTDASGNIVISSTDTNSNTTYSVMTGATTTAAGKVGLVPAPAAGAATRYLRSDGTWTDLPDQSFVDQNLIRTNAQRPILLGPESMKTTAKDYAYFSDLLTGNPATGNLSAVVLEASSSVKAAYIYENGTLLSNKYNPLITLTNNAAVIGTDGASLASGTSWVNRASFSLAAGTWLVIVVVTFNANSSGTRAINISKTSGGAAISVTGTDIRSATSSNYTHCRIVMPIVATATTTYYINAWQNSGAALTTMCRLSTFKIK